MIKITSRMLIALTIGVLAGASLAFVSSEAKKLIMTNDIADGAITAPKIAADAVGASELQGVTQLIFATCEWNSPSDTGTIVNVGSQHKVQCSVPGVEADDRVIATIHEQLEVGQTTPTAHSMAVIQARVNGSMENTVDIWFTSFDDRESLSHLSFNVIVYQVG